MIEEKSALNSCLVPMAVVAVAVKQRDKKGNIHKFDTA